MPYIDLKLTDIIKSKNEDFKQKMMLQLLLAINGMHSHHIAHRDIKPDNLMVFEDNLFVIDLNTSRELKTQYDA